MRGTVADPRVAGTLEWKDGVLAMTGFGEYEEIHLALHGDEDERGARRADGGERRRAARASPGSARHAPGPRLRAVGRGEAGSLPDLHGGPAAGDGGAGGEGRRARGAARHARLDVDIDDARIELPDADRKNLQSLDARRTSCWWTATRRSTARRRRSCRRCSHAATPQGGRGAGPRQPAPAVNAPRHLWVSGKDANLELGLSPDFRVSMGDDARRSSARSPSIAGASTSTGGASTSRRTRR